MTGTIFPDDAPYHAHIYFTPDQADTADALREELTLLSGILFVGRMTEGKAGPHPIPQFEVHFLKQSLGAVLPMIEASGLRTLVHPLTEDDLADHTSLAHWIGDPIELDLATLDPPGINQGVARFGKSDF
jgi:aromatic ring-cleaving dioxygenase